MVTPLLTLGVGRPSSTPPGGTSAGGWRASSCGRGRRGGRGGGGIVVVGGVVAAAWLDAVVAVVPAEVLCVDPPQAASMTLTSTAARIGGRSFAVSIETGG